MKQLVVILQILLIYLNVCAQNNGINNWWISGYASQLGLPNGNFTLNFFPGLPAIAFDSLEMSFNHTHANISDAQGNLLFYTNGYYIADATNDTMMNGSGINPGAYSNFVPDGHLIPQGALIIRKPDSNSEYYMFHSTCDHYPMTGCRAYRLYLSIIDMNLHNGFGTVVQKNNQIIIDTLNTGKIAATKHANGRDWWIMVHRVNSNKFYMVLVDSGGISAVYSQNIGITRGWDAGQAWFSPDGNRYAYFYINGGLEIFDFDRCTGMLSNPVHINLNYENGYNVGVAFSPNSNVLYVSNVFHVYQFDLTAANIPASMDTVATYDGFLASWPPAPPFPTLFALSALAPDGKIYITTCNSTHYFHTIDNPDIVGSGCNVNQHSVQLPAFYFNTLPNHPNYFLGCDTSCTPCLVGLTPGPSPPKAEKGVKATPNPNNGVFTLQFDVQSTAGELEIYDVNGRMVYRDYIAPWSQFKRVDIKDSPQGIYLVRLRWRKESVAVKVVIQYE